MKRLAIVALAVLGSPCGMGPASAQLATGPSPSAGATPVLGRPYAPCGDRPLSRVAVMGRDDGVVGEEKPDVEYPSATSAPGAVPFAASRDSWTYLKAYSGKVGDLFAACVLADGRHVTVALTPGTVSCERDGTAFSCR